MPTTTMTTTMSRSSLSLSSWCFYAVLVVGILATATPTNAFSAPLTRSSVQKAGGTLAFTRTVQPTSTMTTSSTTLFMATDQQQEQQEKLKQLGYSDDDLSRAAPPPPQGPKVAVTEVNIDAFTLSAVGFGLIAFNFLVLANMGDGGIGGVVATIINTWDN